MNSSDENDERNYELAAASHGEATLNGNSKKANHAYSKIVKYLLKLREDEDKGEGSLLRLSKNENLSVACWASTHLLQLNEAEAIDRLKYIAAIDMSTMGFDAEMVLKEWAAGRLRSP